MKQPPRIPSLQVGATDQLSIGTFKAPESIPERRHCPVHLNTCHFNAQMLVAYPNFPEKARMPGPIQHQADTAAKVLNVIS